MTVQCPVFFATGQLDKIGQTGQNWTDWTNWTKLGKLDRLDRLDSNQMKRAVTASAAISPHCTKNKKKKIDF